jgi:hypothetical protein
LQSRKKKAKKAIKKQLMKFENAVGATLYNCEVAITWATSENITELPPNFESLLNRYPIRRLRFKILNASREYNQLQFTKGSPSGKYKTMVDTMDSTKTINELDKWFKNYLQDFYATCLLNGKYQIEQSLQEQKLHGSNPYCIVWRSPTIKNIPWILLYLFLKVRDVHIGYIKTFKKQYIEIKTEKETLKETIQESAEFKIQFNWVIHMLKKIIPNAIKTHVIPNVDDVVPTLQRYCIVWYGPKNDSIPQGLVELMDQFPNVCIGQKISNLHEIWLITNSYSWYKILPDTASLNEIRELIQDFLDKEK